MHITAREGGGSLERNPYTQTPVLIACSPVFSKASLPPEVSWATRTRACGQCMRAHTTQGMRTDHSRRAQGTSFAALNDTNMRFEIDVFKTDGGQRTSLQRIALRTPDADIVAAYTAEFIHQIPPPPPPQPPA
eukprot:1628041-Rhodomonas_salina.1